MLKGKHERRTGITFDLAMLMRYDLAFHADVTWHSLPLAQIWAVAHCCGYQRDPSSFPAVSAAMTQV